jgi:CRISPR type I-E-associated protein CasB/Cse2
VTHIAKRLWWGDPAAAEILRNWHAQLTHPASRAARAALRRVGPAEDACLVPEYGELVLRLREAGFPLSTTRAIRMTAEAVAVAEIDEDGPVFKERDGPRTSAFAEHFAKAVGGGEIAPARSRLLLSTDDPALFLRLLRGSLSMLRAKRKPAPIVAVAEIVRRWTNTERRAVMRRHLALALAGHLAAERKEAS